MRLGNDVERGDPNMGAAELLEGRDGFVVGKPQGRIRPRLHCKFTYWSGDTFQMVDEVSVVPGHVGLHAFKEGYRMRGVCRCRGVVGCRARGGRVGRVVYTKEDVKRMNERALRGAGPRELPRLSEIDGVSTLILKDPRPLTTVLSVKPGADVVVEYAWVAAVADGVEDGGEGADGGGEFAEGGGDAAVGDVVVDEGLVEGLLHEREGGDASALDAGRGEEEVLLVFRAGEEGDAADVAVDLAPVVEHGVCVGDDGGEDELAGDCEEGSREGAGDSDWIGAWWLSVDVDV